jgi:MFS family permease
LPHACQGLPLSSVSSSRLVVFSSGTFVLLQRSRVFVDLPRYDTGTISGIIAMDYWKKEFSTEPDLSITAAQDSLIVSILSAGTFFGALTAAPFGDLLGRRLGLMVSAGAVFNLGVILQTAATAQPLFIAGRFFAGYGVGLISALSKYTHPLLRSIHRM